MEMRNLLTDQDRQEKSPKQQEQSVRQRQAARMNRYEKGLIALLEEKGRKQNASM
ncbi:MAG: hypothetical protein LUD14_04790 [Clostridiales bacterium]|nr:hypothetical protein [Clostridiales bacterium]